MKTLDELHRAYMRDKERDYEEISEIYCNTEDDIVELNNWHPVAKPDKENKRDNNPVRLADFFCLTQFNLR
jgi:hypothetical protein